MEKLRTFLQWKNYGLFLLKTTDFFTKNYVLFYNGKTTYFFTMEKLRTFFTKNYGLFLLKTTDFFTKNYGLFLLKTTDFFYGLFY